MGTTMETTEIRREVWWFSRYVMSYSCDPIDCSLLGSCVHGIFRQEYWSGLLLPPPGDLSDPGIKSVSFASPALSDGFFTTVPP